MRFASLTRFVPTLVLVLATTTTTTTTCTAFVLAPPPQRVGAHHSTALRVASLDPFLEEDDVFMLASLTDYYNGNNNNDNNNNDNKESQPENNDGDVVTQLPLLALQLVAVLGIKAVKDLMHYPPLWIQETFLLRGGEERSVAQGAATEILNPPLLALKLLAVLVFKTAHDAVYYPALWTQRWVTCQSLDECPVVGE